MQKPVFVVILNWLLILVLCYLSWLGLIVWLLVLTMTGNGTQKAAALMARQAYTIERSSRIEEVRTCIISLVCQLTGASIVGLDM